MEQYRNFKEGKWCKQIDVRDFIQRNLHHMKGMMRF